MTSKAKLQKSGDIATEAQKLVKQGFRVVPVSGKSPVIKDWPREAARTEWDVRKLFSREGITGVGIVIDEDFCVVDFDPRNGGDWADYDLPETVVCHTGGGGRHYYYKLPEGVKSQNRKLGPGVDLKGLGGYVVASPSRHPDGGEYVWEVWAAPWEREMALAPAWLVEELIGLGERAYRTRPPIRAGERHNYMVSLAGALAGAGVAGDVIDGVLRDVYDAFFEKGDFDFEKELASIRKYYARWFGTASVKSVLERLPREVREVVERHIGVEERPETPRERKKRVEEAVDALMKAELVWWGGQLYIVAGNVLIPEDAASIYLLKVGLHVSQDTAKQAVGYVVTFRSISELSGIVLGDYLVEGEAAGVSGIWRHDAGKLYCHTADSTLVWEEGMWPTGVYRLARTRGVCVGDGSVEDLLRYMKVSSSRVDADYRVLAAMLAPIVIGAGDAGFIFTGPAGSGKSSFAKALAYLERGNEWGFPAGNSMRDYVASLVKNRVAFFDDNTTVTDELQGLLRSKITHSHVSMRLLYKDYDVAERKLAGSMILCTTAPEDLSHDLADRCFYIKFKGKRGGTREDVLLNYFMTNNAKARAGLIDLWRRAQRVSGPGGLLPQVRFRRWFDTAYKFAVVLGVRDEFLNYVRLSKLNALDTLRFSFIASAFAEGRIETGRFYRLKDIWAAIGNDPEDYAIVRLAKGLRPGTKNAREIETIAAALGYSVVFEKRIVDSAKGNMELGMVFEKADWVNDVSDALPDDSIEPPRSGGAAAPPSLGGTSQQAVLSSGGAQPSGERTESASVASTASGGAQGVSYTSSMLRESITLLDKRFEEVIERIMQGERVMYDMNDRYVTALHGGVEKLWRIKGATGVLEYLTNFINDPKTKSEIEEEEYRHLLAYMLNEIAKARREIWQTLQTKG